MQNRLRQREQSYRPDGGDTRLLEERSGNQQGPGQQRPPPLPVQVIEHERADPHDHQGDHELLLDIAVFGDQRRREIHRRDCHTDSRRQSAIEPTYRNEHECQGDRLEEALEDLRAGFVEARERHAEHVHQQRASLRAGLLVVADPRPGKDVLGGIHVRAAVERVRVAQLEVLAQNERDAGQEENQARHQESPGASVAKGNALLAGVR